MAFCHVLSFSLSSIVIYLLGKSELVALFFLGLWLVSGLSLFALPLGVMGRLCYMIVALPGHLLFYFYF